MTIVGFFVIVVLLAGSIYAIWLDSEEKKAERAKWARIARANSESCERIWPTKSGPKGGPWRDRRAS